MNLKEFIFDGPLYKINITKTKKGVGGILFEKFFKKLYRTIYLFYNLIVFEDIQINRN